MRRTALQLGIPVATMMFGALIGFALGQRQGFSWGTELLRREIDFGLSVHSEVASLIRVGDSERALWWLDQLIDNVILNVSRYSDAHTQLRGLQIAKVYRTAVPPTGTEAALITAALDPVSTVAPPFFCPLPSGVEVQASGLDRLTGPGRR
jgi:hypothetical protein